MQRTQLRIASRLARANPTAVFLVTLVVILVALFTPGVLGGLLTLALAAVVAALVVTTGASQSPRLRVVRLLVLTLLVTAGLVKLF
ncbi:hypothetical protein [Salinispora tropica]|uniref:Uncharacterized protein n=1 Tax=Salinispora tropica (strain ATCC BAA-916 / DSM 44818 / JCM 13857 / NBRC 105044 / CNB-440) TaxID=369723 RepID=A4XAB8_SALTO|nr:hypothetical protein [Salinispora tropica]ABP55867.1 hypothetical protein Strop_3436 [Salinispora tropica CNB-440]